MLGICPVEFTIVTRLIGLHWSALVVAARFFWGWVLILFGSQICGCVHSTHGLLKAVHGSEAAVALREFEDLMFYEFVVHIVFIDFRTFLELFMAMKQLSPCQSLKI